MLTCQAYFRLTSVFRRRIFRAIEGNPARYNIIGRVILVPEQDREKLSGNTIEEKDRSRLAEVISDLAAYTNVRHGLPADPVVVEGEQIFPIPITSASIEILSDQHLEIVSLAPNPSQSRLAKEIHEERARKKAARKAA